MQKAHVGSSPLTRGKLAPSPHAERSAGLIPAHAGKTPQCTGRPNRCWAHPRSRGENLVILKKLAGEDGSSPLTRGKRRGSWSPSMSARLIPAHAGKTASWKRRAGRARAHPRSRGENDDAFTPVDPRVGSSPLTRGKPSRAHYAGIASGLIPAHAGKTTGAASSLASGAAHPRSRGENEITMTTIILNGGSSPLTRGKPEYQFCEWLLRRLIPAHAGKTFLPVRVPLFQGAHPRSRGENGIFPMFSVIFQGSSPLTRGKQQRSRCTCCRMRLIPAHAGKTG